MAPPVATAAPDPDDEPEVIYSDENGMIVFFTPRSPEHPEIPAGTMETSSVDSLLLEFTDTDLPHSRGPG